MRPAPGYVRPERDDGNKRSCDVERHLNDVGPDNGGHTALKGVEQGERGDDRDGEHVAGSNRNGHDDRDGEDANTFCRWTRNEEEARSRLMQRTDEALIEEL